MDEEWDIVEIVEWLGEAWPLDPTASDATEFRRLSSVLERHWATLQEGFAPDRRVGTVEDLKRFAQRRRDEIRKRIMPEG